MSAILLMDLIISRKKEENKVRNKLCLTWHFSNLYIIYLPCVFHQNKNEREWEGFKWEASEIQNNMGMTT